MRRPPPLWPAHPEIGSSRNPNPHCRFSSCAVASRSPVSIDRAPRLVVRKQPVIVRASWLTSNCTYVVGLDTGCHHLPPVDWREAICPVSRRSRSIAFLAFFSLVAWCSFGVRWESSQIPSQRVASLLRGTSWFPTMMLAVGTVLFLWKRAALVFPWSNTIPLAAAQLKDAAA